VSQMCFGFTGLEFKFTVLWDFRGNVDTIQINGIMYHKTIILLLTIVRVTHYKNMYLV